MAGIRTPGADQRVFEERPEQAPADARSRPCPRIYKQLFDIQKRLEKHYKDMQDIEFTIEKGTLYMLQCRVGKRNGVAAVRMATEMYREKLIDAEDRGHARGPEPAGGTAAAHARSRRPKQARRPIAKGLPAGPGRRARAAWSSPRRTPSPGPARGEKVILVREETSPEDVDGMHKSQAILTSKGGMTSHAALVARGWGKCCIVGCADIEVADDNKSFKTKKRRRRHARATGSPSTAPRVSSTRGACPWSTSTSSTTSPTGTS